MESRESGNRPGLEQYLEQVLRHYDEPYFIRRNVEVGGDVVAAMAEMQISEQKRLFGFSAPGMKLGESVAGEYLLFLLEDTLTLTAAEQMIALADKAKKQFLLADTERSYTFISIAALANQIEPDAVKKLKRYRAPGGFQKGWVMTRLVAVCPAEKKVFSNTDGKELGRLLLTRLT